jgi:hypothetical protein
MRQIVLLVFCFVFLYSSAQTTFKSTKFEFEKAGSAKAGEIAQDWAPSLHFIEAPYPGSNSHRAELLRLKEQVYGINGIPQAIERGADPKQKSSLSSPFIFSSFLSNNPDGVPNDNDIAVSNSGIMISAINSIFSVWDLNTNTRLLNRTLASFSSSLNLPNSKYDPKVAYDPRADRFIMVFLNGFTYQTSKIIVAFSQTPDPLGSWNFYALNGNPLNNDTWSDYPVIGISSEELYIGINTFLNGSSNNSGFVETCLWQISLSDGYAGNSLTTEYYSDILQNNNPIFNITPIKGGSNTYGPNMYLLSNRNLSVENDTIFLLEVTDKLSSANRRLDIKVLKSPVAYKLPPNAKQANNYFFDTNDSRVLGGFYENGKIQFVQSCLSQANNRAGIFHGIIDNLTAAPSVNAVIIGDTFDLGFPNISYAGNSSVEDYAIFNCNHSSENVFAGISALQFDGSNYSDIVRIKDGLNYISSMQGTLQRWGDYTGSQRKYNEGGKVWLTGYYATSGRNNASFAAGLSYDFFINSPLTQKQDAYAVTYPNPFSEKVHLEFNCHKSQTYTFEILDLSGKQVQLLLKEFCKEGKNRFSFSTEPLPGGVYFLSCRGESGNIITKKIVKQ